MKGFADEELEEKISLAGTENGRIAENTKGSKANMVPTAESPLIFIQG